MLRKLAALVPQAELVVFSFREEPSEPPFFEDIRKLALEHNARFFEGKQVGGSRWSQFWASNEFDLMFAVSWRYMIPHDVYRRARLGSFVFHDSLLPAYRGFSPTVWAILNGEDHTGVTLFEMAEEVDAGDILDQTPVPIGPHDTIGEVVERVTETYLVLLERNIAALMAGMAVSRPQDPRLATYTCKRMPEDNLIDWSRPSQAIYDLIRAVSRPYSGAYTLLDGRKMLVWSAGPVNPGRYVGSVPGRVAEVRPGVGSLILTGDGSILLTQVELESGHTVCAADVLKSLSQTVGR